MLPSHLHKRRHLPPLTLTPCNTTSSPSSWSVVIFILIAVLTTVCFNSSSTLVHAKIIDSIQPSGKTQSCSQSKDCRNPHKECNVDGKCQCKPYFDYIPKGDLCVKSYGASCTNFETPHEELCNTNKFLACDEMGTCSCHTSGESLLIYDHYLDTCVAPPGHVCDFFAYMDVKMECVRNAKCVHDSSRTEDKDYYGICQCSKGFVAKGEKCIPEFGASCQLDGDCDQDGMRCLEGKCECLEERVYFENGHECKLKAGETCEVAERDCVENAECRGRRNVRAQWEWKCTCELGYQEFTNGTCVKDWHGNCRDFKIYDEKRGRCSLTVGRGCLASGVNLCVTHAFCGTGNKCQCFDGYDVTENGTCRKAEKVTNDNDIVVDEDERHGENSTRKMESPQPYTFSDNRPQEQTSEVDTNSAPGRLFLSYYGDLPSIIFMAAVTVVYFGRW